MGLSIFLGVVFFICFAMLFNEGLWTNAVTLINAVIAGLIATNFFEMGAAWLEEQASTIKYMTDVIAFWVIFGVCFFLFRLATDQISTVKVRFRKPVETAGSVIFACWVGWLMISFSLISLHIGPFPVSPFGGTFQETPETKMVLGTGPDRLWLGFVHHLSRGGSLDRISASAPDFDPRADFILRYGARRATFETEEGLLAK